ncbi:hypothetical protein H5410_016788 [Solanum commersonii]|uniref:Uncharacterized protein n=1 Tax=Solanum commersonii TaxID=4109 RepID=A0A9J5ZYE7_SOLCO|nr:hypothetical protein H5410_016788 [Solanum commersonii]
MLSQHQGPNGGGMLQGIASEGPSTIDSNMNFFVNPSAGHAIASEQSSTAFRGTVGLYFNSLAYSLKRWNM